jgi:hypothetical protein
MLAGVELVSQSKIRLLKIAAKKLQISYFRVLNMDFNVTFIPQSGRQLGLERPVPSAMIT